MKKKEILKILYSGCLLLVFALGAVLPCGASESQTTTEMPEEFDDFISAIPDEVAELLPEGFLSGEKNDFDSALRRASGGEYLINTVLALLGGGFEAAAGTFCTLVGIALIAAIFGSVRQSLFSRGVSDAIGLAVNAAAAVAAVGVQYGRFAAVRSYFENLRMIMSALLPLMGVLYSMGGNTGGAVLNNSTVLLWLEIINLLATSFLIPALSVMTALSLASAFLPGIRLSGISSFIGKTLGSVLGLCAVLLGAALGAQSVLTASGDKLGFKTAKFVAGSVIPVVGSTVGESLSTLAASVRMLRSTVGVAGIVVLILLLLPTLLSLLLTRLSFSAAAGVADMLGSENLARLYREMSSVYGFLIAAAALSALMFVFALTVFALTSAAAAA